MFARILRGGRDRGATMVEYALMLAMIAMVCVGAVQFFGGATGGSLSRSNSVMTAAGGGS
jgi:Flp pilus assembly pilin Flp